MRHPAPATARGRSQFSTRLTEVEMRARMGMLAAVLGLLLAPAVLSAQGYPHKREGFWFSGGMGAASLGCSECEGKRAGGLGASVALGGTLRPNILFGGSVDLWTKTENETSLSVGSVSAVFRIYPKTESGLFVSLGAGGANISLEDPDFGNGEANGAGVVLGGGYDIRIRAKSSITPYVHLVGMSFDGGTANFGGVGVAFTLH